MDCEAATVLDGEKPSTERREYQEEQQWKWILDIAWFQTETQY